MLSSHLNGAENVDVPKYFRIDADPVGGTGHLDESDSPPSAELELVERRLLHESMRRHPSGRRRG